jgi:hypothetical protein
MPPASLGIKRNALLASISVKDIVDDGTILDAILGRDALW